MNFLIKLGVFASFLLVTVLSVWLYSPVIKSHAESETAEVTVDVQPVISLVLDTYQLDLTINPKASGTVSQAKTVTASVRTNGENGYQLHFSSVDDNTDMTSSATSQVIETLSSDNTNLTPATGKNSAWGYSKTNKDGSWNPIPPLSNPKTIKYTFGPNTSDNPTTIYIGVVAKSGQAAGNYTKNVEFTAVTNTAAPALGFNSINYMQQMSSSLCSNAEVGETAILTDSRDDEEYKVMKFEDGKCWMVQNLRMVGPLTITSTESDVETDFALPAPVTSWVESYDTPYVARAKGTYADPVNNVGYNYNAASAGTVNTEEDLTEATHSICPKGWKLPSKAEYSAFFNVNNFTSDEAGYNIAVNNPFNFKPSNFGRWNDSSEYDDGDWWTSEYWSTYSSTAYHYRAVATIGRNKNSSTGEISYTLDSDYLNGKEGSAGIRCVAR